MANMGVELKVVPQFVMHDENELWTSLCVHVCKCVCVCERACVFNFVCVVVWSN